MFFTADILTCHSGKSTGVANNINESSVLFMCSVCHDSVTVSWHEKVQHPGNVEAKWNPAIVI